MLRNGTFLETFPFVPKGEHVAHELGAVAPHGDTDALLLGADSGAHEDSYVAGLSLELFDVSRVDQPVALHAEERTG